MRVRNGHFLLGDCFDRMARLESGSVDMVLCDLPYGTTQNKWDALIPFEPLWAEIWRVTKPNAAVVLTAQSPFDKMLGASQIRHMKYEWIWEKGKATGHLNAKLQPMKAHENILVFYRRQCLYNPQKWVGKPYIAGRGKSNGANYGEYGRERNDSPDGSRYPRSVQKFSSDTQNDASHPTQKPVALFEYLIRTYTNEGELVLDMTAGSGTTAVAAERSGRRWTCIEKDPEYYWNAVARVIELNA